MATLRAIATWFDPRRRLIALVLTGWAVIVIVGAGNAPNAGVSLELPDLSGLVVAAIMIFALTRLAFLFYLRPKLQSGLAPRGTKELRAWVSLAIIVALFASVVHRADTAEDEAPAEEEEVVLTQAGAAGTGEATGAEADATDVVVLLIVGAVAGVFLLRSRRRVGRFGREAGAELDEPKESDLGPAIDEAAMHLRSGHDPRAAVLAAYASLERALADHGHPRFPAETPTEHLARVFAAVPALAAPAVRLGHLYELARFSDHPITSAESEDAASELAIARRSVSAWAVEAS